ncbi:MULTISPECIES: L-lactate permease [Anaerolinea]|uniref:L-lactate permease n=1 Tax=Anaerolinea TaxID=233189 RepID=UPI002623588D|nr:L-lactate permease [Anaerolinea thermophila]
MWTQVYDPFQSPFLSALVAFLPAALLLVALGVFRLRVLYAAALGLAAALLLAVGVFGMPAGMAFASAVFGVAYGFLPVGWIVLNVLFLFRLTEQKGLFQTLQQSLMHLTSDRRLQLVLVAFCLGAFLEGAAGFGTPVAVSASLLVGLGFSPITAAGLSLLANTAPVPYAGLGIPLIALQTVTGLDLQSLTRATALQLTLFNLLIPFWMVAAWVGWKRMLEVAPALLVAGGTFAGVQVLVAFFHGPWLVNIFSSVASMGALVLFLRVWKPRHEMSENVSTPSGGLTSRQVWRAWMPWIILTVLVFLWGIPQVRSFLDAWTLIRIPVPGLHGLVQRVPPVVPQPVVQDAVFQLPWLSASGTAILLAGIVAGLLMGYRPGELLRQYGQTLKRVKVSLLSLSTMMAMGFVLRYAGMDAAMGLAFAYTGGFYPFFGTWLGWLGVFITGSDTSSNVLFGSLQRITAGQLGFSEVWMSAANTAGGVMGKMINTQSIVVAGTAVNLKGREGEVLRFVLFHSLALVTLAGLLVWGLSGPAKVLFP